MTREEAIELLESYDFPEEGPRLTQAAYMGAGALRDELAASPWRLYRRKPEELETSASTSTRPGRRKENT